MANWEAPAGSGGVEAANSANHQGMTEAAAHDEVVLRMENIDKSFQGVKVLSNVSFDLRKGEVHVLLGENGAGKSTLMKIISGLYSLDTGSVYVNNRKVSIRSTQDSQRLGISIIYQEFNLIPDLTVEQNIFLHREPVDRFGTIDVKAMRKKSEELLALLKSTAKPTDKIRSLGVAQQQLVEVAKALSTDAKILILDEPTAALSEQEIERLFETIRTLKANGVSMVYISHRMQELKVIGDRVTVLRDGQSIGTRNLATTELSELITMMVGREISQERIRTVNRSTDYVVLETKNLCRGKRVQNVNINVKKGEIVAVSGIAGAGRTELMHAIFGVDKIDSGEIYLNGKKLDKVTPKRNVARKIGLLPESRKENGLALILPVCQNITAAALKKLCKNGFLSEREEMRVTNDYIKRLNIVTPGGRQLVRNLSGGNQQKVVLAKWLYSESSLLIFDEPTRGIDIGARQEIYRVMDSLTEEGKSILMVSSDLPEIMTIADRIFVMRDGRIAAELDAATTDQEEVLAYATGGREAVS